MPDTREVLEASIRRRRIICAGVTIGEGSVIGAGSVVIRDIPAGVVAAGVPCKVIRQLTEDDVIPENAISD